MVIRAMLALLIVLSGAVSRSATQMPVSLYSSSSSWGKIVALIVELDKPIKRDGQYDVVIKKVIYGPGIVVGAKVEIGFKLAGAPMESGVCLLLLEINDYEFTFDANMRYTLGDIESKLKLTSTNEERVGDIVTLVNIAVLKGQENKLLMVNSLLANNCSDYLLQNLIAFKAEIIKNEQIDLNCKCMGIVYEYNIHSIYTVIKADEVYTNSDSEWKKSGNRKALFRKIRLFYKGNDNVVNEYIDGVLENG